MFLEAVTRYNALIFRSLESGEIQEAIKGMKGLKTELWGLIGEQVYQRVVGPKMDDLGVSARRVACPCPPFEMND